jgi:uncharacterized protein DUF1570
MNRAPGVAVLLLLSFAAYARADDKAVAAIRKQQDAAETKCAAEFVKCAKTLAAMKAFDEARDELRIAMLLAPQDAVCRKEYAKLLASRTGTPDAVVPKLNDVRNPVRERCVATLVPVLQAWDKADRPEEFARLATATVGCLGQPEPVHALGLAWYEPYGFWARQKDAERWEKGDEFVDGAWLDAEKVKALDAQHANWTTPWVIGDGVHEVRTSMPLRAARRVLEYVRSYRRFVADYFVGEWEWKQPKAPLPIFLTATQADYQARLGAYDSNATRSKASAIYVQKTGGICPVFVTFEPKDAGGSKIDWPALLRDVRHETAHQILYESAMAQGAGVGGNIDWVSEGIANFLACHEPRNGVWRLTRRDREPYANGYEPGAFSWVRANFDKVPPLSKYFGEFKSNLDSPEEYFVATTLVYFLLWGSDGRWRPSAVKLIADVHMAKGGPKSFADCFGKPDLAKMQEEWKSFVDGISIEKK